MYKSMCIYIYIYIYSSLFGRVPVVVFAWSASECTLAACSAAFTCSACSAAVLPWCSAVFGHRPTPTFVQCSAEGVFGVFGKRLLRTLSP